MNTATETLDTSAIDLDSSLAAVNTGTAALNTATGTTNTEMTNLATNTRTAAEELAGTDGKGGLTLAQTTFTTAVENTQTAWATLIKDTITQGKLDFGSFFTTVKDGFVTMVAEIAAQNITNAIFGSGGLSGFLSSLTSGFGSIISSIASGLGGVVSQFVASLSGARLGGSAAGAAGGSGIVSGITGAVSSAIGSVIGGGGSAAAAQTAIAAGTSTMAANAALAAGTSTAAGSIAAGTSTMAANAAVGSAATGTAAAGSGGFSSALAAAGPYAAAILAAYVAAELLDSGGTPTKTAGLTSAKTGGMSEGNIVRGLQSFASGYTPLGFKQNANDQEVATAIAPFKELDATLTGMAQDLGLSVNLAGHTFNGYGVEGTGAGTVLGTFIEENKMKGAKLSDQVNRYASEWINAVGVRNGIAANVISDVIGDGTTAGIISRASKIINASGMGPLGGSSSGSDITLGVGTGNRFDSATDSNNSGISLSIDGSHQGGLSSVPYDGYIAELHAGERVQTAAQVAATDRMSSEMVGLRNNLNELMLVVAKAVTKTARIEDRWDKNGLPPVRA